jgi:hypothetical protein
MLRYPGLLSSSKRPVLFQVSLFVAISEVTTLGEAQDMVLRVIVDMREQRAHLKEAARLFRLSLPPQAAIL